MSDFGVIKLSLNLNFKIGQVGNWTVHKATIASTSPTILGHSTTGPHGQDTTSEVSEGPVHTQPKPKFEWRPKFGPSGVPGVQVY